MPNRRMIFARVPSNVVAVATIAALIIIPLFANRYQQYVMNLILVYVPVAIGFNVVTGNLGQLAFCNVAFFGLGAYTSVVLVKFWLVPWWITVPIAGLAGSAAAAIVSLAALRGLRGFYLAIVTLAFGELMRWSYIHAEAVTGGTTGMALPSADVFGFQTVRDIEKYYVLLAVAFLAIVGTSRLLRSRFGRAFVAIKNNELAAAAMGVPTGRFFVTGFAWSGFLVGVGGALYAFLVGYISPEAFGLHELLLQFAIVVVGGLGSIPGSILGSVAITLLPELVRNYAGFQEVALGLLIVAVVLFYPGGLATVLRRITGHRDRFTMRP